MIRDDERTAFMNSAGFTLLELVIVLAILAIVLAVAIPAASPSRQAMALKTNALALTAQMKILRTAAVHRNVEHILLIDVQRNVFWVAGQATARRIAPQLTLHAQMPGQEVVDSTTVRFRFFPDGTTSGGAIVLKNGSRAAQVALDWRTGAPQIAWSR